jgi:hypothetical protein
MKIFFEKRSVRDLRQAIEDAKEESDSATLRDDLVDMFSDDQVEEIERRLDTDDFLDFLDQVIEEWAEEESDELLDILTERLGEIGIELAIEDDDDDDDDDEGIDDELSDETFDEDDEEDEDF